MTEPLPGPTPHATDPITAILVAITEMRGELRAALADLRRHDGDIARHDRDIAALRDKVTTLEAVDRTEEAQRNHAVSARAVFWTAVGGVVAFAALLVTVLVMARHGI